MPPNRSRTDRWRESLQQVYERGGGLEISLQRPDGQSSGSSQQTARDDDISHLVWRVKITKITEEEIVVESPMTLGQAIPLEPGVGLICAIVIGQNRWMFETKILGHLEKSLGPDRTLVHLRLESPQKVERCSRRQFYRMSTVALNLPRVSCWSLLDPDSARVAEQANQVQMIAALEGAGATGAVEPDEASLALPVVGPKFQARLVNIGGGGIGILVDPEDAGVLGRHRTFWLHIALPPELPLPLGVTARLAHTHMDSSQRTYAGLAFEFGHNRSHEKFVVNQLTHYVEKQQQAILGRGYRQAS